jgi:hypothetical protein
MWFRNPEGKTPHGRPSHRRDCTDFDIQKAELRGPTFICFLSHRYAQARKPARNCDVPKLGVNLFHKNASDTRGGWKENEANEEENIIITSVFLCHVHIFPKNYPILPERTKDIIY